MSRKKNMYIAQNPTTATDDTPMASLMFFFFSFSKLAGISKISSSKTDPLSFLWIFLRRGCKFLATRFDGSDGFIDFSGESITFYNFRAFLQISCRSAYGLIHPFLLERTVFGTILSKQVVMGLSRIPRRLRRT